MRSVMLYTLAAVVFVVCFVGGVIIAGLTQSDQLKFAWGALQLVIWLVGAGAAALLIRAARATGSLQSSPNPR